MEELKNSIESERMNRSREILREYLPGARVEVNTDRRTERLDGTSLHEVAAEINGFIYRASRANREEALKAIADRYRRENPPRQPTRRGGVRCDLFEALGNALNPYPAHLNI